MMASVLPQTDDFHFALQILAVDSVRNAQG